MTALSDLLTSANTANMSARRLAAAAQNAGFTLNHDTAARYLRGDHGRPDESTLLAFATVLHLDMHALRRAAALPAESIEPYQPPPEASRLNRRQRRAVDEIIRAMLERVESGPTDARDAVVRELPTPRSRRGAAARRGDAEASGASEGRSTIPRPSATDPSTTDH